MERPPTNRLQRRLLAFRVYDLECRVREKLQTAAEQGLPLPPDAAGVPDVLSRWAAEIADGQQYLP
jgi:hypothetical protein